MFQDMPKVNNSDGSSGGELTPTVLWENPTASPTSFANQAVGLNDDINNYKYLKFKFFTADVSGIVTCAPMITVEDFKLTSTGNGTFGISFRQQATNGSTLYYTTFNYLTDANIYVTRSTTSGKYLIPYQIIGLK